jgi:TRAP transporter TAXI family solute receptor
LVGTAPVGSAFRQVGDALANVLNENGGDNDWEIKSKGTKGSKQNIRELDSGDVRLAMANSAITYHAINGAADWDKEYEIRTVLTLAKNVGVFVAKEDSGIQTIADLKGKRVAVGPAGAGFEIFLKPLLAEHGVTYEDFTPENQIYSDSVGALADGNIDAAFMGGAIPLPALSQACSTQSIRFISYDEEARLRLIEDTDKYPFLQDAMIPAKNSEGRATYAGMTDDFQAIDVGTTHLITTIDEDEDLIYQITKTLWENREQVGKQHAGTGDAISEANAARFTGTPFHDGAIRFYKEIGIWQGDGSDASADESE